MGTALVCGTVDLNCGMTVFCLRNNHVAFSYHFQKTISKGYNFLHSYIPNKPHVFRTALLDHIFFVKWSTLMANQKFMLRMCNVILKISVLFVTFLDPSLETSLYYSSSFSIILCQFCIRVFMKPTDSVKHFVRQ